MTDSSIGIAIPCYRPHLAVLPRLLDSISKQSCLPKEVVVSCSSTKDSDPKPTFPEYPFEFKILYHSERKNAAENRNIAADLLTTDYIGFFDADDIMVSRRIEMIQAAITEGADFIVHSYSQNIRDLSIPITPVAYAYNVLVPNKETSGLTGRVGAVHHSQPIVHRRIFEQCRQPEGRSCERAEDSVFCFNAIAFSQKNAYIPAALSIYLPAGFWYKC